MQPVHLYHTDTDYEPAVLTAAPPEEQEGQWPSKFSNTLDQMFLSRLHEEYTEENMY